MNTHRRKTADDKGKNFYQLTTAWSIPDDGSDVADLWLGFLAHWTSTHWTLLLGTHEIFSVRDALDSAGDLVERIVVAADEINTPPGIF
ncbi:hypothetical protein AVEN_13663-1 [Araneus ventricosus]|uniref:Uncharacterized protein n=1 Tax=Araneus ventricosus TaxID=182803 RepID=A0A4Y2MVZ1_ARAVE|nr:hypothetical protein AVEN_13663-1 [Araneus ventricosus]